MQKLNKLNELRKPKELIKIAEYLNKVKGLNFKVNTLFKSLDFQFKAYRISLYYDGWNKNKFVVDGWERGIEFNEMGTTFNQFIKILNYKIGL